MAVVSKGTTFASGNQVTAANLNALVDSATFATGAVDNSTTQLSGGAIIVKDGGIGTSKFAAGSSFPATTTNDSAAAGYVGEYMSSSIASGSAVAAVLNTAVNITSLSLTAGDWDVDGIVYFLPDGSTAWDLFLASASTTSATQASRDTGDQGILKVSGGFGVGIASSLPIPSRRISIASTTTVYLVGTVSFSAGSPTMYGTIRARRAR